MATSGWPWRLWKGSADRPLPGPVGPPAPQAFPADAPAEDRLAMASVAVAGIEGISVLDLELRREGLSYSLLTVREVSEGNPEADLLFLIGADAFAEISTCTGTAISSPRVISCSSPDRGFRPKRRFPRIRIEPEGNRCYNLPGCSYVSPADAGCFARLFRSWTFRRDPSGKRFAGEIAPGAGAARCRAIHHGPRPVPWGRERVAGHRHAGHTASMRRPRTEKKGFDILALDVREHAGFTDYFLICSGSSDRQVQAVSRHIAETLKKERGIKTLGTEGLREGDGCSSTTVISWCTCSRTACESSTTSTSCGGRRQRCAVPQE